MNQQPTKKPTTKPKPTQPDATKPKTSPTRLNPKQPPATQPTTSTSTTPETKQRQIRSSQEATRTTRMQPRTTKPAQAPPPPPIQSHPPQKIILGHELYLLRRYSLFWAVGRKIAIAVPENDYKMITELKNNLFE